MSVLVSLIALTTVLLVVLSVTVFVTTEIALAQSSSNSSASATQSPVPPPSDQSAPVSTQQTFNGKIMKLGSKFVLKDSGTTYQLDDQQKARELLNKSVKMTGVLDTVTGTIRVSAIASA